MLETLYYLAGIIFLVTAYISSMAVMLSLTVYTVLALLASIKKMKKGN